MENITNNDQGIELRTTYKLIQVGIPFRSNDCDLFVMPCYFQPWLRTSDSSADLPIVIRNVNSNIAGNLICGSFWTNSTHIAKTTCHRNSDSQIFWTGSNALFATLLKNIINPAILTPSSFWITKGETWVICIEFNAKTIIIPYFELLRTLFYSASRRLTQFFLSFLSLELLCQPLSSPSDRNPLVAHFYVASKQLKESEARILGGLLFDPALRQIFDLGQNHWLNANDVKTAQRKSAGRFSKSILFDADGRSFTHNNKQYFWVDSLKIINSPYNFRELLFHPIEDSKTYLPYLGDSFICSDLLQDGVTPSKQLDFYCFSHRTARKIHSLSTSRKEKTKKYLTSLNTVLPYVTCSLPWANAPTENKKKKFYWLDRELSERVQFIDKESYGNTIKYTAGFENVIYKFIRKGHKVDYLTINNPRSIFGSNASVFPVNNYTALPISIYKNSIRVFTIAKISLSYSSVFLVQPFPEQNPELIILCQKQDLNMPSDLEWNKLINILLV